MTVSRAPGVRAVVYADAVRVMAVLAVIVIHVSGIRVSNLKDAAGADWAIANSLDSFSRWAVPAFVMLSGALLLDPGKKESSALFYKKRLIRVGIPAVFWIAFYFFWAAWFRDQPVSAASIKISLLGGLLESPLYFLFIIIGLYLVTPFLRAAVAGVSPWVCASAVLLMFGLLVNGVIARFLPMTVWTQFVPYIAYFLAGHLLKEFRPVRSGLVSMIAAGIVFVSASAWITVRTSGLMGRFGIEDHRSLVLYDHFCVWVVIQTLAAFMAIRYFYVWRGAAAPGSLTAFLGKASFGIYLLHPFILDLARTYISPHLQAPVPAVMLTEVSVTFAASAVLTGVLLRIPWVSRIVGS